MMTTSEPPVLPTVVEQPLGVWATLYGDGRVRKGALLMLLAVILFGLFVEHVIFKAIEDRTVRRWGMQV